MAARFKSARLCLEARIKGMTAAIREDCGMSEGLDFACGDCWLEIARLTYRQQTDYRAGKRIFLWP